MTIQSLFKYGKINEHSESVFSTPTVWFSAPGDLNDPFECRPWLTFNGTREQFVDSIASGMRQNYPEMTPENLKAHAVSIFLEGHHRNTNTLENMRRDIITKLEHEIGLYCLSEHRDSILMWSHYADNHCGYCLEFEASNHTPFFGAAQKVNYDAEYPVVDFFNTPNEEQVDLIFLTKFEGWVYEDEWRIIDHDTGPGTKEYPPELLRSVTFGQRMPERERETIRAWVERRGHDVDFFEAQRDDQQYKITVNEID